MRPLCLSVRVPPLLQPKVKLLKISDFKVSAQNNEGCRSSRHRFHYGSVKISHVLHVGEETVMESPKIQKVSLPYTKGEATITGSPIVHNLLKKWLMLRKQSSIQATADIFSAPQGDILKSQNDSQKQEGRNILLVAWCFFLRIDVTVKIPVLIFTALFLAVNVMYGVEVLKELTPLWVLGPLIVALYTKMLIFSLKQTDRMVKCLLIYFLMAYNYMTQGRLKEDLQSQFWQPLVDIKNRDYKELFKRKLKGLEECAVEKYQDYVQSMWPYYRRTIRSLKKANLI